MTTPRTRHTSPVFREPESVNFDWREVKRAFERHIGAPWRVTNYGPTGVCLYHAPSRYSVVVSQGQVAEDDATQWIHASVANAEFDPSYIDLAVLHRAAFGDDKYAYQLFVPRSYHYTFHQHALHLWGRADGQALTPEFTDYYGSI